MWRTKLLYKFTRMNNIIKGRFLLFMSYIVWIDVQILLQAQWQDLAQDKLHCHDY